jgi:hypothetical protein
MAVGIDESGTDDFSGGIDDPFCLGSLKGAYFHDAIPLNADVSRVGRVSCAVCNPTVANNNIQHHYFLSLLSIQ